MSGIFFSHSWLRKSQSLLTKGWRDCTARDNCYLSRVECYPLAVVSTGSPVYERGGISYRCCWRHAYCILAASQRVFVSSVSYWMVIDHSRCDVISWAGTLSADADVTVPFWDESGVHVLMASRCMLWSGVCPSCLSRKVVRGSGRVENSGS